jgi:hypothetical protein
MGREDQRRRSFMEYRDIQYTIRARPGQNEWSWSIYPENSPLIRGETKGTKQLAIAAAHRAIDRWLEKHSGKQKLL